LAAPRSASAPSLAEADSAVAVEASATARGPDPQGLFKKLVWLTLFRLAVVTVLLGATAVYTWRAGKDEAHAAAAPFYGLILATYFVSLAFAFALRAHRWLTALAYAQIGLDVVIAAQVVALTGYSESVFVFLFSLAIVSGSILLYRRGALAAAALAVATYLALVLGGEPRGHAGVPLFRLFAHGSAFLATAVLASYLAELLRRTGERLEAREGDLAEITALHEAIVQSVSSGLLTVDVHGRVTFLNRAGERITGLALREVVGRPSERWFADLQPLQARDETDFVNARGEKLRLGYTLSPLKGRHGEQIGTAIVFQDLTSWRGMQEAVERSERLADLGRVAAGLAHELRNPLASMSGSIELLMVNTSLREEELRLMDIVLREAARLNQLITRLLEFTRSTPPRREAVDLGKLIGETLEVFANDPGAQRVRIEPAIEPTPLSCDSDQMKQVIWNLLSNAAQAVGGRDGDGPAGVIRIRCAPLPDGGARLEVADDGPGITPADLPKVFVPFFTTKQRGSGLGLAMVQRIVDAHGGTVSVDSAPGQGATFTIRIPIARLEGAASPRAKEA
jgi:two-component system sensor histidine kinase PilS (NtrC family)